MQPPGLALPAELIEHPPEGEIKVRYLHRFRVVFGKPHRLLHQLQGPGTVALDRIHRLAAAAVSTAFELTGDHKTPVVVAEVVFGRRS